VPAVESVTSHVATPDETAIAAHKVVPASVKETVPPVGTPALEPTFAVKVMGSLVRLEFTDEESTVLVVATGVTAVDAADAGPVPAALVAVTVKV